MKKRIIPAILFTLAALLLTGCRFGYPPTRKELITDPKDYLKTNMYVANQRKTLAGEGSLTPDFLPAQIDPTRTDAYLYWYSFASDPSYAVTVTLSFTDEEALQHERERIQKLDGFAETRLDDDRSVLYRQSVPLHLGWLFDDHVIDGVEYVMEYAILSPAERTITYSEVDVWEAQTVNETILSQLRLLHECMGDAGSGV